MKYRAILLDFYGTCVAEDDAIIGSIARAIGSEAGAEPADVARAWGFAELCEQSFGASFLSQERIERDTLAELIARFGVSLSPDALSEELFAYWRSPDVFPDTRSFLMRQSVPICVVSNIDNSFIWEAIAQLDFPFAHVVTSEDARAYKPRSEIFEEALRRVGCAPEEVVHIGDSYSADVMGARGCGIDAIWVNRKGRRVEDSVAMLEVATLSEIRWG